MEKIYTAKEIKTLIESTVLGQDTAVTRLSLLFSMHLAWIRRGDKEHPSPSALIIGPTGCGKTHSIRTFAKILKLPFIVVDSTSLVPSGYKGRQVEEILYELIIEANSMIRSEKQSESTETKKNIFDWGDDEVENNAVEKAQNGIVFFDEFDKLANRPEEKDSSWRYAIQRSLLKIIEGSLICTSRGTNRGSGPIIDTSGVLFLAGGAFTGINDSAIRRLRTVELCRELTHSKQVDSVVSEDIINYGFMPELVARIPILINFDSLNESALLDILNNDNVSPLKVWKNHFESFGKKITFGPDFLSAIASRASKMGLGARGLQQVLFPYLTKHTYEFETSSDQELTLNGKHLTNQ